MCNSAKRDVAIDNLGAYGSKVVNVNRINIDAGEVSGIAVIIGNWS